MIPAWKKNLQPVLKFLLLTLPVTIAAVRYDLFSDGITSFGLSAALMVADWNEFLRIFNSDIAEFWIAALFLICWIGGFLFFQLHPSRNSGIPASHLSPGQMAWAKIKKDRLVIFFLYFVTILYVVSFLCPFLSPTDPHFQQDIVVTRYARPMKTIGYLKLKPSAPNLPVRAGDGMVVSTANLLIRVNDRLLHRTGRRIYIDGYEIHGQEIEYRQGIQKKTIPVGDLISDRQADFAGSQTFVLGSDRFGRDILSRIIYGSRISLTIGFLAVIIAVGLGTGIGTVAGYFGNRIDRALMRFVDLALSFPNIFLVLLIMALFGQSIFLLILVLGFTGWMGVARIVRGQILSLKEQEFILAAHALGFSNSRIMFRHLVPNALAPIIVAATLRLGNIILIEAGLSFLGLGVQPPMASWGNIINEGRDTLIQAWWISTFPGVAIVATVIGFNIIGDGLRDALDPRLTTD